LFQGGPHKTDRDTAGEQTAIQQKSVRQSARRWLGGRESVPRVRPTGCNIGHMTRGFTLVELLLAVALVAAVTGIAIPRLQRPLDRLAVERAAYDLAAAHFRARTTAIARNRVTLLMVSADSIRIRVLAGRDTVTRWARESGGAYGVRVTGSSRWLRFHPSGIGFGLANGSWTFSRGATQRRVIVSRLGRLRVSP